MKRWIGAGAVFVLLVAGAVLWVWTAPPPAASPSPSPSASASPSSPAPDARRTRGLPIPAARRRADEGRTLEQLRRPPGRPPLERLLPPQSDAGEPAPASVWPPTREGIDGAIHEAMPAIFECYQGWLAVDPDIEGRIVLDFTVAEDPDEPGTARSGDVTVAESTTGAAAFEACVTSVFSDLLFDIPAEPVSVTYPVLFSPG